MILEDNKNVSIPRSVLKKIGGFSLDMEAGSEDVELGKRLYRAGFPIYYDEKIVAFHNERTTLGSFLSQHARIARSHRALDRRLSPGEKIRLVNVYTWRRHTQSFFLREKEYVQKKRLKDAIFLPLIYFLLGCTRIIGYLEIFR